MDEKKLIEEIRKKIESQASIDIDSEERARSLVFKTSEEAKAYLDRLFIEYSFQCYSEKRADGCYRLANYHENITGRFDTAAELHKRNCDESNYPRSCYLYGVAKIMGRGSKIDNLEAFNYSLKACDYNVAKACQNAAALTIQANGVKQDAQLGLRLFEKACELKHAESCLQACAMYYHEQYIPKNYEKALECAKKACELNHLAGCLHASFMYKKGEGTPVDLEQSKLYHDKAVEIKKSLKPQPGVSFGETHNV